METLSLDIFSYNLPNIYLSDKKHSFIKNVCLVCYVYRPRLGLSYFYQFDLH